jgi:subtilase family serine protease
VRSVRQWARAHGFTTHLGQARTHLRLRGRADTAEQQFRLGQIGRYRTQYGYHYRGSSQAPRVPKALRPYVDHVFGLDHAIVPPRQAATTPVTPGATPGPRVPMRPTTPVTPTTPTGAPTAPADVWGIYGNASITAQWAPVSAGAFRAVASPGGAACTAPATATQCVISGLTNGTSYTIVVSVTANGLTAASAPSSPISPAAPWPASCATTPAAGGSPTPVGVATQYGFNTLGQAATAPAQTIAIIGMGMVPDIGDVKATLTNCNTSPGANTIKLQLQNLPGAAITVGDELTFDTQWVAALAPANTTIVVINAPSTLAGWQEAMDAALALPNLEAVTASYGMPEQWLYTEAANSVAGTSTSPLAAIQTITDAFNQVAATTSIFVAAGDWGSWGAQSTPPVGCVSNSSGDAEVSWPASIPSVTAVGGTQWPNGPTRAGEAVWFQPLGTSPMWPCTGAATGGGMSQLYTQNTWQQTAMAPISTTMRLVPDVSLLAGPPGYLMAMGGQLTTFMGTSASAPTLAAATLRMNASMIASGGSGNALGPLDQYLYSVPAARVTLDLTTGTNDLFGNGQCCTAGPGFDMTSGLGVPTALTDWVTVFTQLNNGQTPTISAPSLRSNRPDRRFSPGQATNRMRRRGQTLLSQYRSGTC